MVIMLMEYTNNLGLTSCAAEVKQEWGKEPHNLAQSEMW